MNSKEIHIIGISEDGWVSYGDERIRIGWVHLRHFSSTPVEGQIWTLSTEVGRVISLIKIGKENK